MELKTANDAVKLIDGALASGDMSEGVHKSLHAYLAKKSDVDSLTFWEEEVCYGKDEDDEHTSYAAAHYVATSYFKISPEDKEMEDGPFVKYDRMGGTDSQPAGAAPIFSAFRDLREQDLKWPVALKFLKKEEVPEDVLEQEKVTKQAMEQANKKVGRKEREVFEKCIAKKRKPGP